MGGYSPLKITGQKTGLVQEREKFLLPDDAYPSLLNAYLWREGIRRKNGIQLLGRLRRRIQTTVFAPVPAGVASVSFTNYLFTTLGLSAAQEPNAQIAPGFISFSVSAPNAATFVDNGDGTFDVTGAGNAGTSSINYRTGNIVLGFTGLTAPGSTMTTTTWYNPNLPVMGIRKKLNRDSSNETTIFFDQRYAYEYDTSLDAFKEYIAGTTWNARGAGVDSIDFFWSTNYWVSATPPFTTSNLNLFWVTNNTGSAANLADPPRISDGVSWIDFYDDATPANTPWAQIDATNYLVNWLCMLPFRGRLLVFNTWEGINATNALNYSKRIRWCTIGNPFIAYTAGPPAAGSWRDDIRGQGGFLDIPTNEDIVSVGFVRDNLVIYCERSTWQLRYTGRSIAPFQVERVNSELGAFGTFSAIQFDTSLLGVGDKGVVECDSYKSERIDVKIPDLVFSIQNANNGFKRVHGVRDFIKRLAYWTLPMVYGYDGNSAGADRIFPNRRLVYNYENGSWSLFTDTFTCLGTFQPQSSRTWENTNLPWIRCKFSWRTSQPPSIPSIVGGNQQGFVMYLTRDEVNANDSSLYISQITGNTTTATVITVPNHNLVSTTGSQSITNVPYVVEITDIPTGTPFASLNNQIFGISVVDKDNLALYTYDTVSRRFTTPQLDAPATYIGAGKLKTRDNFSVVSKKFNFLDDGNSIQMGYLDVLMNASGDSNPGAITFKVFLDYNEAESSNTLPQNQINDYSTANDPDNFFNSTIPTTASVYNTKGGQKFWQRVYCPTRANFLTLQYTFSNGQLASSEQLTDVQIDAQILWLRKAGRLAQL